MNLYTSIWHQLTQLRDTMPAYYQDTLLQTAELQGLKGLPLGMLFHAYDLYPELLSADRVQACVPHYHTAPFLERIEQLTEAEYLTSTDGIHFALTPEAYAKVDTVYQAVVAQIGRLNPLPEADLRWLVTLFQGLVERALASDFPTPAALMQDHSARNADAHPFAQILDAIDVLYNFRCDAHQAAYRPENLHPAAHEALTLLWRHGYKTVADLVNHLAQEFPRGYSVADYTGFLVSLCERGLLTENQGEFELTEAGRNLRETIEAKTDVYFYRPWQPLSLAELDRLEALLILLAERLKAQTQP